MHIDTKSFPLLFPLINNSFLLLLLVPVAFCSSLLGIGTHHYISEQSTLQEMLETGQGYGSPHHSREK